MSRLIIDLSSAANQYGANGKHITLKVPIEGVFHLELLATSIQLLNVLIQIEGFGESVTNSGRLYWRFVDSVSNQRTNEWQTSKMTYKEPKVLKEMDMLFYDYSGRLIDTSNVFSTSCWIEIAVYSMNKS